MRTLIIVGAGGHGMEAAWVAEEMRATLPTDLQWSIAGLADDDSGKVGQRVYGYPILGVPEQVAQQLHHQSVWYHCAIGDNAIREQMVPRLDRLGWIPATLIHPSVIQARGATVGEGCYVGAMSILSPMCVVGRHVLINQRAGIGHDVVLEDFVQICPGVQLGGAAQVGRGALLGANTSIYPGRSVGQWAVVGASSLVVQSVPARTSVAGIPARPFTPPRPASM